MYSPSEETKTFAKNGLRDTTDGKEITEWKKKLNLSLKLRAKENNSLPMCVLAVCFKFCIDSLVGPGMKTDPKRDENTIAFIPSDKCEGLYLLAEF